MRIGIGLKGSDQSSNQGSIKNNLPNYSVTNDEKDDENNVVSVELNIQYLKYWKVRENLFLYGGIGPRLTFNYIDMKSTNFTLSDNENFLITEIRYEKRRGYSIGIVSSFGVEWFFNDFMSLHSEYSFAFNYYNNLDENTTRDINYQSIELSTTNKRKTDGYQFISSGVKLGLSVYF